MLWYEGLVEGRELARQSRDKECRQKVADEGVKSGVCKCLGVKIAHHT